MTPVNAAPISSPEPATSGGRDGPLAGLRVLDLSTMIAAPLVSALLADYGADVVKVERPGGGDFVRVFGAQQDGVGLYWKVLNRGKRSIALDLHYPEAQDIVRRWVPTFDIVVENFRPGTLERWNLAPGQLREITPRLIFLRVTAYGQDGPYRERPGFGTLAEAMAGLASLSGFADRPPLLPAYPLADILAAHLGSTAVLAALRRRDLTGEGEIIDLAIYEAALKLIEVNILEFTQLGTLHQRAGNQSGTSAPRGSYKCRDGAWIAISGSTGPLADRIMRAIGGEALTADPRFATNADRTAHAADLDAIIAKWCASRDREDAIAELTAAGGAVGPLETIPSMLQNAQVMARRSIVKVDDPSLGSLAMTGVFPRFSEASCSTRPPAPTVVGADTRDLLTGELGLSPEDVDRLVHAGVCAIGGPASR